MSQPDGARRVRADLVLEVDGIEASVVGDGDRLTVSTTDASGLLTHAASAMHATPVSAGSREFRQMIKFVGQRLDDAGVSVQVVDSRGTLLEIGNDCTSAVGRLLLGSAHARLGGTRAVLAAVAGFVRQSPSIRNRVVSAVGGLVIAGLVVATAAGRPQRTDR